MRERFAELQAKDEEHKRVPWHIVDASNSVEEVQKDINAIVERTLEKVQKGSPLYQMFQDGEYTLSIPEKEN